MLHEICISASKKEELIDITGDVEEIAKKINNGIALIFVKHTTAGIFVNEAEEGLLNDMLNILGKTVPKGSYEHNKKDSRKNAEAHLKAILIGSSITVPIKDGKIELGKWQRILFAEFDGPQDRTILVKLVGE